MSTPSSPSYSTPPNPTHNHFPTTTIVAALAVAGAVKKPQPVLWSHNETVHLIEAYKEKWYSLNRGQLKAGHWEEVSVNVSVRCGTDQATARSSTQCRHKIEKLRKRFRSEKQSSGHLSSWTYFCLMDDLDRGPLPISARPLSHLPPVNDYVVEDDVDVDEEEDEEEYSKSRSINSILRRPSNVNRFAGSGSHGTKKMKLKEEDGMGVKRERRAGLEIAAEIRGFAERIMVVEKKKIEMMRETERCRMELEKKRTEMIRSSQRKVVDLIARAFQS